MGGQHQKRWRVRHLKLSIDGKQGAPCHHFPQKEDCKPPDTTAERDALTRLSGLKLAIHKESDILQLVKEQPSGRELHSSLAGLGPATTGHITRHETLAGA